jgi:hypothetical protein
MTEIIFILAATIVGFSMFLVVYFLKDRSDSDNRQRPTCTRCDCHRGQKQYDPALKQSKQLEKEVRLCSTVRLLERSASD